MKAWEQQPGETSQAYRAARIYFDLGPGRTLLLTTQKVATASESPRRPTKAPRSPSGSIKGWAKQWRWAKRAQAFDQTLDSAGDQARIAERENQATVQERRRAQVIEDGWIAAQQTKVKAIQMLHGPLYETTTETTRSPDGTTVTVVTQIPTNWRIRDAAVLLRLASDLERLSLGMPTRVEVPRSTPEAPPVDQAQADLDNGRVPQHLADAWLDMAAKEALDYQGYSGAQPEY